jgi:hypothetical protein
MLQGHARQESFALRSNAGKCQVFCHRRAAGHQMRPGADWLGDRGNVRAWSRQSQTTDHRTRVTSDRWVPRAAIRITGAELLNSTRCGLSHPARHSPLHDPKRLSGLCKMSRHISISHQGNSESWTTQNAAWRQQNAPHPRRTMQPVRGFATRHPAGAE